MKFFSLSTDDPFDDVRSAVALSLIDRFGGIGGDDRCQVWEALEQLGSFWRAMSARCFGEGCEPVMHVFWELKQCCTSWNVNTFQ